jgi:hypothetical protein
MKNKHLNPTILITFVLFSVVLLACGLSLPGSAPKCTANDGTFSSWTSAQTGLILFEVSGCKINKFQFALNPAISVDGTQASGTLYSFSLPDGIEVKGNQFSLETEKGSGKVSVSGTFTAPADVEGTIQITEGVTFDNNPLISFTQDVADTWSGSVK